MVKKTIKLRTVLFCVLVAVLIKPDAVTWFPLIDLCWDFGVLGVFLVYTPYSLFKKRIAKSDCILALFCILYCGCTFFTAQENTLGAISSCIRIWLGFSCIKYLIGSKDYCTVGAVAVVFSVGLYLDFMLFITNYAFGFLRDPRFSLFGYDNYAIFAIIPMLALVFFVSFIKHGFYSLNAVLLLVLMLVEKIMTGAATAIVVLGLLAVAFYFIKYRPTMKNLFNHKTGLAVLLSLSMLIIVFHAQELFASFFEMFGKDATLSGRTFIWDGALRAISDNVVFGHGRTTGEMFLVLAQLPLYEASWGHTHNGVLELLYSVGLVGTLFYFAFLISVFKGMQSDEKKYIWGKEILFAGVFAYAILMFTDSYIFLVPFYILLAIIDLPVGKVALNKEKDSAHFL